MKRQGNRSTGKRAATAFSEAAAHEGAANRLGRNDWQLYAGHRERLTAAILGAHSQGQGRVALLGAGNCNDVDLEALAAQFAEVHLVDLDAEATSGARLRLPATLRNMIFAQAPVDVSGLLPTWAAFGQREPRFAEIDDWANIGAQAVAAALPGPFDLVVSCCVLTQMSWGLNHFLGAGHPMLANAREALMAAHFRSFANLAPQGHALFVCDMISTEYHPLDDLPPNTDLGNVMQELIAAGNFYQGANPVMLRRLLRNDPVMSSAAKSIEWLVPWLWHGPLERTYLVYALKLAFGTP